MSDIDDEHTEAIDAVHPTRTGTHDQWAVAMQMVSNRHSKGALVALVHWLICGRDAAEARAARLEKALHEMLLVVNYPSTARHIAESAIAAAEPKEPTNV